MATYELESTPLALFTIDFLLTILYFPAKASLVTTPKLLILGSLGQVGWDLQSTLQGLGEITAWDIAELDLGDATQVRRKVVEVRPSVIVNAAAYTNVDGAEEQAELARKINATVPGELARLSAELGSLFLHYSTDYVFNGRSTTPYREDDATDPLGAYGKTKLEGEQAVTAAGGWSRTLRTSWVYSSRAKNFLRTIVSAAAAGKPLRVVNDQHGVPTCSTWLALATAHIIRSELSHPTRKPALYHVTGSGPTTWFEFASAIVEELRPAGLQCPAPEPIASDTFPTKTKRPQFSVLSCEKLRKDYGLTAPHWRETLRLALRGQRLESLVYGAEKK